MATLYFPVWCQAWYDTELEVPDGLTKEGAFAYAKEHLDDAPLTQIHYLPDSDMIDDEDFDKVRLITKEEVSAKTGPDKIENDYIRYLKSDPDAGELEKFLGYPVTGAVFICLDGAVEEVLKQMPEDELKALAYDWNNRRENNG